MHRSESFDERVSKKIQQSRDYGQGFLLTLMEDDDGLSVEDALRIVIQTMGVTEFSRFIGVKPPTVMAFVKKTRNLKPETLNNYLRPFGLKTEIIVKKVS